MTQRIEKDFLFDTAIHFEDGFYINGIPIYDEDGNAGSIVGSVYHDNFKDFNFEICIFSRA